MKKMILDGNWLVKSVTCEEEVININPSSGDNQLIAATVPGDIHNDLLQAGFYDDPFVDDNLKQCEWVNQEDWCFTKTFSVEKGFLDNHCKLTFLGIDTFADIYLNKIKLGSSDSMFIKHTFDVTGCIKEGENILSVVIKSINREMEKYPSEGYESCFNIPRIFIRKPSCHFSWDWSPDLPAAGIYDSVFLESISGSKIENICVRTQNSGFATFFFELDETYYKEHTKKEIKLHLSGNGFDNTYSFIMSERLQHFSLKIDNPSLWWPHGLGEQPLYFYEADLFEEGRQADSKTGSFAFREISVDESPRDDNEGLRFSVKINNVQVFLKGANWVPAEIFTGIIKEEKYKKLLSAVTDGNMNCLRVWGGGFYEKDIFYNECDRLGILIWQDFMFSCAELPDGSTEFFEKVQEELIYQIKRLRNHPSIIIWCGGNERNGQIQKGNCIGKDKFEFLFRGIAGHLDKTRPYFDNSPWGYEELGNSIRSGDTHLSSMNEAIYAKDALKFRRLLSDLTASMMTEIACMGSCPISSVKKYISEDNLWPTNPIWDLHIRGNPYDPTGETFLIQQTRLAEQHFGSVSGLYDFVKKSAIIQAEHIKADIEFHRSREFDCSGALLWMFNDIWPCASWSIIDYYLTKKAGYYAMSRACRPVLPIISYHKDGYKAFVSNETQDRMIGDVCITHLNTDGTKIQEVIFKSIEIKETSCTLISTMETFDLTLQDSIFFITFTPDEEEPIINSIIVKSFSMVNFPEPKIEIAEFTGDNGLYTITLLCGTCTRFVCLLAENADFSDNYFDMKANTPYKIAIKSDRKLTINDIVIKTFYEEWNE